MMRLALAAALALSGSILLHGAGLVAVPARGEDQLAGGEGRLPPLLGDSFADLSQGMALAVDAAAPLAPVTAPPVQAVTPVAAVVTPMTPDGMAPVRPDIAPPVTAPLAALSAPVAALRVPPPATTVTTSDARPTPRPAEAPKPAAAPKRDPVPEKPKPKAKAKPAKPEPAAPKGGETAARKGTADGRADGSSSQTGARQKAEGDGGKAAQASYGRGVMRKIAATRKKTTGLRGKAVIAFSIGPGGQLASVRVARSSGSADLDALGLDHIRRAAPFPPPPSGNTTRFSVEFVGR